MTYLWHKRFYTFIIIKPETDFVGGTEITIVTFTFISSVSNGSCFLKKSTYFFYTRRSHTVTKTTSDKLHEYFYCLYIGHVIGWATRSNAREPRERWKLDPWGKQRTFHIFEANHVRPPRVESEDKTLIKSKVR